MVGELGVGGLEGWRVRGVGVGGCIGWVEGVRGAEAMASDPPTHPWGFPFTFLRSLLISLLSFFYCDLN